MKLIILGNGFDLHHGLKTSFDHFKSWCNDKEFIIKVDEIIDRRIDVLNEKNYLSWANVEEMFHKEYLEIEKKNRLIKKINEYDEEKKQQPIATPSFKGQKPNRDQTREIMATEINEIPTKYTLETFLELSMDFTEYFNEYLKSEVINELVLSNHKLKKEFSNDAHILNFNYTNTHKIYGNKINTLCIHGNLKNGLFPVIGYYHDVKYPIPVKSSDVHIKYENKIFSKDTIFERMHNKELVPMIQEFFNPLKNEISEIVIIGYSIGNSDDFVNQLILQNCKMHGEDGFLPIDNTVTLDVLKVKIYNYRNSFDNGKEKIKSLLAEQYKTVTITGDSIRGRKIPNIEFIEKQY